MKVAVIFHRLGPYHFARLEAAAARCEVVGIELGAETDEYEWTKVEGISGFQRITLFPEGDSRSSPTHELENRMRGALSASQPDVVAIPGWSEKGGLFALRWCTEKKVPAVLMSESTATDEPRRWWKELVKRRIVALCSSALVGGVRHREYLSDLGMPRDRVFTGYDAVDNAFFAQGAKEVRGRRSEVGREHGLPENYFLASARFFPKKNLDTLIRAYAQYRERSEVRDQRSDLWSLVILGDGPLKSDLCRLISDLRLEHSVLLPGFKQYDELPTYYALASAFVHASTTEQWGLVVNEAMASGLPVMVSDRCGCATDLVQEGKNGFTFDPYNVEQLAQLMFKLSALQSFKLSAFGDANREIISGFDVAAFGSGLRQAMEVASQRPVVRPGLLDRLLLRLLFLK